MDEKETARVSHKSDHESTIVVAALCDIEYLLFSLSDAVGDLDILSTA